MYPQSTWPVAELLRRLSYVADTLKVVFPTADTVAI